MIEIKALSYFQGNPQSSVHKSNFWNSFTKQTQQFQSTSNVKLSRKETKKAKKEQENRHSNDHVPVVKEQLTTILKQNKKI